MTDTTLSVAKRDVAIKPKKLRAQDIIPANVYGGGDSIAIQLPHQLFIHELSKIGESTLLYLKIDAAKKPIPVLIDEVDLHPITRAPLHIVFRKVDLTEAVEAEITVELEGEVDIPDALLVQLVDTIQVRALPTDLPEKFVLSVDSLEAVGDSLTSAQLDFDKSKVELVAVTEEEPEIIIAQVQEVRAEEPEEEPEVPVEGEGDSDGSAPEGDGGSDDADASPDESAAE